MALRGISQEDVEEALQSILGEERKGSGKGTVTYIGQSNGGRLGVALREDDREVVVSAWWNQR